MGASPPIFPNRRTARKMNTVLEWAAYFRANPDHLMTYRKTSEGVGVWRHGEGVAPVGERLGLFPTLGEAGSVVVAGRELAARSPKLVQSTLAL